MDLLLDTVHRIGAKAEHRVERELLEDLKRVAGKNGLLFQLAEAALDASRRHRPGGRLPGRRRADACATWSRNGRPPGRPTGKQRADRHPQLLSAPTTAACCRPCCDALEFRSNNERHRPVIDALALLKKYADSKLRTFPPEEDVPLDGVVRGSLAGGRPREGQGRQSARSTASTTRSASSKPCGSGCAAKEIWVVGADRYRNPDEDLPADFEAQRAAYYAALQHPQDAETFVAGLQQEMREALAIFDRGLPENPARQDPGQGQAAGSRSPPGSRSPSRSTSRP